MELSRATTASQTTSKTTGAVLDNSHKLGPLALHSYQESRTIERHDIMPRWVKKSNMLTHHRPEPNLDVFTLLEYLQGNWNFPFKVNDVGHPSSGGLEALSACQPPPSKNRGNHQQPNPIPLLAFSLTFIPRHLPSNSNMASLFIQVHMQGGKQTWPSGQRKRPAPGTR